LWLLLNVSKHHGIANIIIIIVIVIVIIVVKLLIFIISDSVQGYAEYSLIYVFVKYEVPIPVAMQSQAQVCRRSISGIAGCESR
jgi:flagellar basal body-associated protein FliL